MRLSDIICCVIILCALLAFCAACSGPDWNGIGKLTPRPQFYILHVSGEPGFAPFEVYDDCMKFGADLKRHAPNITYECKA